MGKTVTVGSRGSKLAVIQAESVAAKLRELDPSLDITIIKIVTRGDRSHHTPFDRMNTVGIFVKELEDALITGQIDLAVHSLKDMPTIIPDQLSLAAAIERLDHRDVLLTRAGKLSELPSGAKIGTGSFRREVQLRAFRADLKISSIRGNVDTRYGKVLSGEFDGVILAAAAIIRMGWEDKVSEYLPVEHFLPAVGQGALGIEIRREDKEMAGHAALLNHIPTWRSVVAERAFLSALGGGCREPIAALGDVSGNRLKLKGMVADREGKNMLYAAEEGDAGQPEQIGVELARKLLAMGASEFITEAIV